MYNCKLYNKRTDGPVNAHLRPEIYVPINLFDQNGDIHVYNPRAGSEQTLESISLLNHKDSFHLPIYCKFCPSNDIVTIFTIQM